MLALAATITGSAAHAQSYPVKPVRIIIPFPPGGGTDVFGRLLGQKLTQALGQQVLIDNRPGGGGTIGTRLCKNYLRCLRSDEASGCWGRLWGDTSTGRIERRVFCSRSDWMSGLTKTTRCARLTCLLMNSI